MSEYLNGCPECGRILSSCTIQYINGQRQQHYRCVCGTKWFVANKQKFYDPEKAK